MEEEVVALRAFEEGDLGFLDRLGTDPDASGPFVWTGFADPRRRRRRWERDGYIGADSAALAVVVAGTVAGIASWQLRDRAGPSGVCYEIGLVLVPDYRGQGYGVIAQRLLVDYLFRFTTVHRLEALTDAENGAERTALERIGFVLEGVLRGVAFHQGTWRDAAMYALLRDRSTHRPD
jgi:RimJ/RimL family protein N-acetyltransferase